jgi:hypothetical protein
MRGEKREEWQRLCRLAADEQDSHKLMELIHGVSINCWKKRKSASNSSGKGKQQHPKSRVAHATRSAPSTSKT